MGKICLIIAWVLFAQTFEICKAEDDLSGIGLLGTPSNNILPQSFVTLDPIEKAKDLYSAKQMEKAANAMKQFAAVVGKGPYLPNFDSIDSHASSGWFDDAKFGIFFDWGLYSIPGWAPRENGKAMYPDWYLSFMYTKDDVRSYHQKTWGSNFGRDDFIPLFTAAGFDADAVVDLAVRAGAKYFIPFSKHHDGYCLWNSSFTFRDSVDMMPGRDIADELIKACRARGLKFGFYFSIDEWEYPLISKQSNNVIVRLWVEKRPHNINPETGNYDTTRPYLAETDKKLFSGKVPVRNYLEDYLIPQFKEFVDRYDPDIVWFDGAWDRWEITADDYRSTEMTAYFFNQAEGRKSVVVNDRFGSGTRKKHGDFYTSEFHDGHESLKHKWEEARSIGQSYGYNREDDENNLLSSQELIRMFIDIVSKGGNLLLVVNPDGSGYVPENQRQRLLDMGKWLKVNGEAIYNTRMYSPNKEGESVYFTQSKDSDTIYAISIGWPGQVLTLHNVLSSEVAEISLLGSAQKIHWKSLPSGGIDILLPNGIQNKSNSKLHNAFAFKIKCTR